MQRLLWISLLTILVSGCQNEGSSEPLVKSDAIQPERPEAGFVACGDERPEMCTHIYQPVCAKVTERECLKEDCPSSWKTYGNACSACADLSVAGYIAGACD